MISIATDRCPRSLLSRSSINALVYASHRVSFVQDGSVRSVCVRTRAPTRHSSPPDEEPAHFDPSLQPRRYIGPVGYYPEQIGLGFGGTDGYPLPTSAAPPSDMYAPAHYESSSPYAHASNPHWHAYATGSATPESNAAAWSPPGLRLTPPDQQQGGWLPSATLSDGRQWPGSFEGGDDDSDDDEDGTSSVSGHSTARSSSSAASLNSAFVHGMALGQYSPGGAFLNTPGAVNPAEIALPPSLSSSYASSYSSSHRSYFPLPPLASPLGPPHQVIGFDTDDVAPRQPRQRDRTVRPSSASSSRSRKRTYRDKRDDVSGGEDGGDPDYDPYQDAVDSSPSSSRRRHDGGTVRARNEDTVRAGASSSRQPLSAAFFAAPDSPGAEVDAVGDLDDDEVAPKAKRSRGRRPATDSSLGLAELAAQGIDPNVEPNEHVRRFAGTTKTGKVKKVFMCVAGAAGHR